MNEDQFTIPRNSDGTPDKEKVAALEADQLAFWIGARLRGSDPWFPLNMERGEDPKGVFTWMFNNIYDHRFINNFSLALSRILKKESARDWNAKDETDREFFYRLMFLIEYFYSVCGTEKAPHSRTNADDNVAKILRNLCRPDGPLSGAIHQGVDVLMRVLFALRSAEGVYDYDFWISIKKLRDGIYFTPAFGAIAVWNPVCAIELLPEYIAASGRHPEMVKPAFEIYMLFNSHPWIIKQKPENIRSAFSGHAAEWQIFRGILQNRNIVLPEPDIIVGENELTNENLIRKLGEDYKDKYPGFFKEIQHPTDYSSRAGRAAARLVNECAPQPIH